MTSRSINSLIWALLLVAIVGPGLLAGIIAIGLQLQSSLNTLVWNQVTVIFLVILVTIVVSEWVSAKVRRAVL